MIQQRPILIFILFLFMLLEIQFPMSGFSQDSISKVRFLVIESTKFTDWQTSPERIIFQTGSNIAIKRYNKSAIRGKIDYFTDSSIIIKDRYINLNEIKCVNNRKGLKGTKIGLFSIAASSVMIVSSFVLFPVKYDMYHDDDTNGWTRFYFQVPFITCAFTGSIITVIGLFKMVTVKQYRINKNCKLYVKN